MHAARRPLQTFLATMLTVMAMVSIRAGAGDATSGEKFAFLVGVQNYEGDLNTLNYAEADVDGLAEVLRKNVKLLPDHIVLMTQPQSIGKSPRRYPTKALILEQLDLLLAGLREQDLLIVALAGHGVQFKDDDEERYFCPIDAKLSDRSTLIPLGEVRRRMERARAGWKLLFVDASRVDPLNPQSRIALPDVRVEERGGARPPSAGDVITFYSCSKGERAFEDPKSGHGVFFRFLIDGIGGEADLDGDGLGTWGELQTYVSRNVRNFVRDQHSVSQQPELVGNVDPKRILVAFQPARLLLKQGKELFERGRFDEVITVCTRLLEINPGWAEAYHLRGRARILENRDATSAAIGDFTAAIQHAKSFAEAYYDRGLVYLQIGEWDPSIRDFSEAIQLNFAGPDVWFFRGVASLRRDRTDEAVADFTKAIQLNPGFAAAFLNRGLARTRQKKLEEALADYDKAIALDSKMGEAFLNRGVIRLIRGELDEAIADFDRAVERCRRAGDVVNLVPAYFDRGKAFFLKKDYERAIEDWEVVINQFDERNRMTLDFLGLASTHLRNEAKAARYFEEAVRLDERLTYAPAHAHLGALRYNQRDYDDAIKECTKAIEIDRTLVDAYFTRSLAYKATKQRDKATADEREVAKLRGAARDGPRPAEKHP